MSYVPQPSAIRAMMAAAPPDALDLAIGEPDIPTPKIILDHLQKNIHKWHLGYSPNAGLPALRELIATKAGVWIQPEQVCITSGAQEALYVACHTLLRTGDEALIPDPGFLAYGELVKMAGAEPVTYPAPIASEPFDFERFKQCISSKAKLLFLNSPSNPTGRSLQDDEIKELVRICAEHKIMILSDEVYRELYYGESKPASVAEFSENCVIISSLSKMLSMTGWRLGWLIGPAGFMRKFITTHQFLTTCASVVAQHTALFALTDEAAEAKREIRETLCAQRDQFADHLRRTGRWRFHIPDAGLFLFAKPTAQDCIDDRALSRDLLSDKKIITTPGSAFGERGKGYLRFSFGAGKDVLEKAGRLLSER